MLQVPVTLTRHPPVGGRLQNFWKVWEKLGTDPHIVRILKEGLKLQFLAKPTLTAPIVLESYGNNQLKQSALKEAISEMQRKGVLEEVTSPRALGVYGRLFVKEKTNGKWRTIIDMKVLNENIDNPTFFMESIHSIQNSMRGGLWTTSIDLSDAYFHIPIHKLYRKFLRVALFGKVWQFRAMPMGLNVSARVFTKVVLEMLKVLRKEGIWVHAYLDDLLIRHKDKGVLETQTKRVWNLCQELGFLVNKEKSDLVPKQRFTYVGVSFDLVTGIAGVPLERLEKLEGAIEKILERRTATAREWMSLLGLMSSCMHQIQLGPLHRRPIQWFLADRWKQRQSKQHWEAVIQLEDYLIPYLNWWLHRENTGQGVSLEPFSPELALYTDASSTGFGATLGNKELKGVWTGKERQDLSHSNNLELMAIIKAIEWFQEDIKGKVLLICTDNSSALSAINNQGSPKSRSLDRLARRLWQELDRLDCRVKARHIPGRLNIRADCLSRQRQVITTEWSLHPEALEPVWEKWGKPLIDLFATRLNKKMKMFVSPVPDEEAWKVDAMSISWTGLSAYAFPPWAMMTAVLQKVLEDQSEVILVAPDWPGRVWYPLLLELATDEPISLGGSGRLLRQMHSGKMHNNPGVLNLKAWRLSGKLLQNRASVRESLSA